MTITEIKEKYPQYKDLSDEQLAQGLYKKYYFDLDYNQFKTKIGLSEIKVSESAQQTSLEDRLGTTILEKGKELVSKIPIVEMAQDIASQPPFWKPKERLKYLSERWQSMTPLERGMQAAFAVTEIPAGAVKIPMAKKPILDEGPAAEIPKVTPTSAKPIQEVGKFPLPQEAQAKLQQVKTKIISEPKPKPKPFNAETDTLADFIRKEGGIKTTEAGEAQRFTVREGYNLINTKTGKGLDALRERAVEEGFIDRDASLSEFIELIRKDVDAKIQGIPGQVWSLSKQNWFEDIIAPSEEAMMAKTRAGGAEIGAVGPVLPQQPGRIVNVPKLERMRQEAAIEYKRTIMDKTLDLLRPLRDPRRYLSNTQNGAQLADKTIELERTLERAGNIAQEAVDRAFTPIRGRGVKGAFMRLKEPAKVQQATKEVGQALDGKIQLTDPQKIVVYKKLRRITNFYADALGLPPEGRIAEYFPHVFRGQYRVRLRDAHGVEHTIPGGFANTQREAYFKAEEYLGRLKQEEATSTTLYIEETFRPELMSDMASKLDYKRFQALKNAILEEKPVEELIPLAGKLAFAPGPKPKVFFRHLLKRRVNLQGYEQDAYEVFTQFVRGANRKIYFDRYLPEAEKLIEQLPKEQQAYAQQLVEYMKGTPGITDRLADNMFKELGFDLKPQAVTRVARAINEYFYIAKLGLGNLSGAAVNSLTLLTNAPVKIGPRATGEGIYLYFKSFADPKIGAILRREGPGISRLGEIEPGVKGLVIHGAGWTAKPFQAIEDMTHGAVFLGARNKYLRENLRPGITPSQKATIMKEASRYGRQMDLETQIPQTRATRAAFFRDPLLRAGFQFKSFLPKMLETFAHMTPKEKAAFVAAILVVGGPYAIPGVRYLADRHPEGAKVVDWLNDHAVIPRLMGFDFSGDVGVGFIPDDARSLMGPGSQLAVEGAEATLKVATGESTKETKSQFTKTVRPALPYRVTKGIEQIKEGVIKDERGRPIVEVTPGETINYILFGARSKAAQEQYQKNRRFRVIEQQEKNQRIELIDTYLDAMEANDERKKQQILDNIEEHNQIYVPLLGTGITADMVRNAAQARKMTKAERLFKYGKKKGAAYKEFIEK